MPSASDIVDPPLAAVETQPQVMQTGMAVDNEYQIIPGTCIIPVAESPPEDPQELATWSPVIVLKLHAPYRIRKVRHSAKKQNTPPVLPSPVSVGKFVFVGGTISFDTDLNSSLAAYDWSVGTEYVYVEDCVSRTIDGFILGTPSYETIIQQENLQSVGGLPSPQIGAIAEGGTDAKVGYAMSQDVGNPDGLWTYNCPSYYPGDLFNDNLINGGFTPLS